MRSLFAATTAYVSATAVSAPAAPGVQCAGLSLDTTITTLEAKSCFQRIGTDGTAVTMFQNHPTQLNALCQTFGFPGFSGTMSGTQCGYNTWQNIFPGGCCADGDVSGWSQSGGNARCYGNGYTQIECDPNPPPPPSNPPPPPMCPCTDNSEATAGQDPHLTLGHGGRTDFRGVNGTIYAFVSSRNVSMGVRTEDAVFKLHKLTVHGSFLTAAYFNFRTIKGRDFHISFDTHDVNAQGWGWRMISGDCARPGNTVPFHLSPHRRRECDDVVASVEASSLTIKHPEWAFVVTTQPVYDRISGPHHRLDIKVSLAGDEKVLIPHGILGHSFDGDGRPRMGALDVYPDKSIPGEFTTKAMAEGAIQGTASDYVLYAPRATPSSLAFEQR